MQETPCVFKEALDADVAHFLRQTLLSQPSQSG
jgi:hypothetical protein